MKIEPTLIPDVKIIEPARHGDERGFLSEVFKLSALREAGLPTEWNQDNHSRSAAPFTIRGLHFQAPPFAQAKLVRVTRGRILDVAVDLRRSSPTYGRHVAVELSEQNWRQALIPVGFAHGFCTLEPETEVQYKVTAEYNPAYDFGVLWSDGDLAIDWPVSPAKAIVSAKDRTLPAFKSLPTYFE